jgi:hypothetical protein
VKEEMISKILRALPREKAFYFFTSIGNYTGESAASLKEFAEKINEVNIKSLEFHLYRRDFEKWIDETLEDKELAIEIRNLRSLNYSGTMLKEHLYSIVAKRYGKLSGDIKIV